MTSISALSTTRTTSTTTAAVKKRQDPMEKLAATLGMTKDDLKTQLKSGKSLDDVATAQGVSHDDLISAIKAGMPSKAGGADSTEMAEKIASTKGGPKPPPGGHKGMNGARRPANKAERAPSHA